MVPLIVVSVIAAFLLLMVAFGLFGVLWQNTTQRIPEIGLRRAVGASAATSTARSSPNSCCSVPPAMRVGLVLLVQLPLTGALGEA
jgi:putative ABC transport system permease protein